MSWVARKCVYSGKKEEEEEDKNERLLFTYAIVRNASSGKQASISWRLRDKIRTSPLKIRTLLLALLFPTIDRRIWKKKENVNFSM